ncbi:DUF2690 domain-containing protein [Streptomyces sp. NPDC020875]|uniref:helix-turn-helix domain-containing protein n=1 Tax=Streptomyces sp. NPDC020875 TaxID=3154898 RepID=UPI0033FDFA1F
MPEWKALPEGLDPDIRALTEELRRIVDAGGLDIAGLSVATGFGVTSWERYLDGRVLPPQRAIAALAERTGTSGHGLASLRSRAERAWHRLEAGRDRATEQLRVARTRSWASVPGGVPGSPASTSPSSPPSPSSSSAPSSSSSSSSASSSASSASVGSSPSSAAVAGPGPDGGSDAVTDDGRPVWNAVLPDDGGPATPPQGAYRVPEGGGRAAARRARRAAEAAAAAAAGTAPAEPGAPGTAAGPARTASGAEAPAATAGSPAPPPAPAASGGLDKRRVLLFLSGVVGALVLVAAAVLLTDLGGTGGGDDGRNDRTETVAKVPPASSAGTKPRPGGGEETGGEETGGESAAPPANVKCVGATCTGKSPEAMGCGGDLVRTVSQATVGKARIEVRFSQVCQAAWARLVDASTGDSVEISVGGEGLQRGTVNGESDAYTPMTAAVKGSDAKACAELTNGTTACTVVQ